MDFAEETKQKPRAAVKVDRACQNCIHFVAAVRNPGAGLCSLYNAIVAFGDGCRSGFQSRLQEPKGDAFVR